MSGDDRGSCAPVITKWIGRLHGTGEVLHAPEPFLLAGLDWHRPGPARLELRARRVGGGWSPWLLASVLGHDSHAGEAIVHAHVGEPVWTDHADAVQLRCAEAVDGISLHLVRAAAVAAPAAADLPLATPHLPAGPGQPAIIARSVWAGELRPKAAPGYGDVRMAFVHHSVNANGYGAEQVPAMLRSIYVFHTYVRGWNDLGYNFAIDAYGRAWEGRAGGIDRPVVGAQAGGYNSESFGVVLLGDFATSMPTSAARSTLAHLIAWKLALHGVPVRGRVMVEVEPSDAHYTRYRRGQHVTLPRIAAHRDGCTTDCPGEDMFINGMAPLRRSVAGLVGRQRALTIQAGPPAGAAYAIAPYRIAPGTRVERPTFLQLQTIIVPGGQQLPLHGHLRLLSGASLPHRRITLQKLGSSRDEDPEVELGRAITDRRGLWSTTLDPQSNMLLRALHAGEHSTVSPLVLVAVKPLLDLTVWPTGGGVLDVAGSVVPFKPHVLLEIRSSSGVHRDAKRMILETVDGTFTTKLKLAPGHYLIQAISPADAANVAGASPQVRVEI